MEHLKTYENYNGLGDKTIKPNFKEGDIIVCIDNNGRDTLIKGNKYKVKYIFNDNGRWKVKLEEKNHSTWQYFAIRFLSEAEYNAKKYNI